MRLLLVEDDKPLGEGIRAGLRQEGYTVDWATDGGMAELALRAEHFDLVVLDLGLPVRQGLDILKSMRTRGQDTPVLVLTARDTVADRVQGLNSGGDDYLVKPFDLDELCARIRALLRRSCGRTSPVIHHGNLAVDPVAHRVTVGGRMVDISRREFAVLRTLLENVGRVLSKSRLEEMLYGWDMDIESNTVEVYIHHLRKKLGNDLIHTVRGVGYMVRKAT